MFIRLTVKYKYAINNADDCSMNMGDIAIIGNKRLAVVFLTADNGDKNSITTFCL